MPMLERLIPLCATALLGLFLVAAIAKEMYHFLRAKVEGGMTTDLVDGYSVATYP